MRVDYFSVLLSVPLIYPGVVSGKPKMFQEKVTPSSQIICGERVVSRRQIFWSFPALLKVSVSSEAAVLIPPPGTHQLVTASPDTPLGTPVWHQQSCSTRSSFTDMVEVHLFRVECFTHPPIPTTSEVY